MPVRVKLFLDVTGPSEHDAPIAEASTRRPEAVRGVGSERCIITQSADMLRELTRTRVIGALERLAAPGVHTALLLDNHTRRVLSSVCRMSEVMEAGQLTLVDNVHTEPSERAPAGLRSHMRVIYLVSPTASSIAAIVDDYQEAPIYGGACHILLSRRLPTEMLQELRDCSLLMRHVQTLRELNIGVVSLQVRRWPGQTERPPVPCTRCRPPTAALPPACAAHSAR